MDQANKLHTALFTSNLFCKEKEINGIVMNVSYVQNKISDVRFMLKNHILTYSAELLGNSIQKPIIMSTKP